MSNISLSLNSKIIKRLPQTTVVFIVCVTESILLGKFSKSQGYEYLFLLPLSYALSYMIFMPLIRSKCEYRRGFAYWIAQIVIFYRALIVPLSCLYTEYFGGWTAHGTNGFGIEPSAKSKLIAILWMCSETFFAELAIYIGTRITWNMGHKMKWRFKIERRPLFLKRKTILVLFTICAFILLILFQNQLFSQFMVLSSDYQQEDNAAGGSFFTVIFLAFRFSFLLLGYAISAKGYEKHKNKVWILLAMLFLIVYIGYSVGVSRWMLILPAIASVEIFRECFKPFPVSFALGIGIVAFISMLSISFYKFGYLLIGEENPVQAMIILIFQQSNEYISGPRSVAQGLETLNAFETRIHISTFFNSLFSGFIGVASLTNDMDKLQSFFNYYCIGGVMQDRPLICPIIVEGLAFCPVFPWIFSMIFEIGVCIFDFMSSSHDRYEFRFICTYLGLWFALCFCINTKIAMSQISNILPCILLLWVNTKFHLKINKR